MKKLIITFIIGMTFGATTTLAAVQKYKDVPLGLWFSEAVYNLSEKEIIGGYPDGTYKPENAVNRAELAVILDRLISQIQKGEIEKLKDAQKTFESKEQCEASMNCSCDFTTCDYIPEGKTFEEVCGIGFTPGYKCTN